MQGHEGASLLAPGDPETQVYRRPRPPDRAVSMELVREFSGSVDPDTGVEQTGLMAK